MTGARDFSNALEMHRREDPRSELEGVWSVCVREGGSELRSGC